MQPIYDAPVRSTLATNRLNLNKKSSTRKFWLNYIIRNASYLKTPIRPYFVWIIISIPANYLMMVHHVLLIVEDHHAHSTNYRKVMDVLYKAFLLYVIIILSTY